MLQAGQQVGEYLIEAEIGGGGMAKVYRARHSVLDTVHALKVLDPKYRVNPEARKRFLDEAKIQAKHLNHHNIVKVTNIVATSEVAALVMDLVVGGSLEDFIQKRKKPVSRDEFLGLAVPILEAIGHAHDEGIVHRDIKPANVLLDEQNGQIVPKLTDFGIAKVGDKLSSKKKSTHADARMGTLAYMSPEQIRQAKNVTARSDIFSIGAMFYEMATGVSPFDGDSDFDIMQAIVQGNFKDPQVLAKADLPPHVVAAIKRALEPDPDKRFESCDQFIAALGGKSVPRAVTVSGTGGGERRWGIFAVLAVLALGAGGAAVFFATRGGESKDYAKIITVSDAGAAAKPVPVGVAGARDILPPDAAAKPAPAPPDAANPRLAALKKPSPGTDKMDKAAELERAKKLIAEEKARRAKEKREREKREREKRERERRTRDTDRDGIPDIKDRCPRQKEDKDGFRDKDGCPDPDNDGDGIPDYKDRCKNKKEDFDFDRDSDGCPD